MLSLQQISSTTSPHPYASRLKVKVVATADTTSYTDKKGTLKEVTEVGVADKTGARKMSLYGAKQKLVVLAWYIIQHFFVRDGIIRCTDATRIFRTNCNDDIAEDFLDLARNMVLPIVSSIDKVKKMHSKGCIKALFRGKVTKVETTKDLMVKGVATKLTTIMVDDGTDTIPVNLWRDASSSPVKVGSNAEFRGRLNFNSFEKRLVCHINDPKDVEIQESMDEEKLLTLIAVSSSDDGDFIFLTDELEGETAMSKEIAETLFLITSEEGITADLPMAIHASIKEDRIFKAELHFPIADEIS